MTVGFYAECVIIITYEELYLNREKEAKAMNYGYLAAASAYIIWGLLPVFWKLLAQLPGRVYFKRPYCVLLFLLCCAGVVKKELGTD